MSNHESARLNKYEIEELEEWLANASPVFRQSVMAAVKTEGTKRDLAIKVLAAINDCHGDLMPDRYNNGIDDAYEAARRVFTESGIELTTPQQQEGE
jgi:hypothetical protein